MPEKLQINLMFEWGGGTLWCGNDLARARFPVGNIEEFLPIASETLARLNDLTQWHDTALNWDYPPDPGPWDASEQSRFSDAANAILKLIQDELGSEYQVVYAPL